MTDILFLCVPSHRGSFFARYKRLTKRPLHIWQSPLLVLTYCTFFPMCRSAGVLYFSIVGISVLLISFPPFLVFLFTLLLCDLSWTYFSAKVIGCPNLANAGILPRVSRQNLPLHLSSVFCRISFVRLFPPPSEGSKINPSGRKQAE